MYCNKPRAIGSNSFLISIIIEGLKVNILSRTSDGGNGNHTVLLPINLIIIKED